VRRCSFSAILLFLAIRYGDLHVAEGLLPAVRGTGDGDQIVEIRPEHGDVRVLVSSPGFLAAPSTSTSTSTSTQPS